MGCTRQNIFYMGQHFTWDIVFTWVAWVNFFFAWVAWVFVRVKYIFAWVFVWSKYFAWVQNLCVNQFFGGWDSFYLLDYIILLQYS